MAHSIKSDDTTKLFEHMLKLKTVQDFYNFFEDLATIQEIKELSLRFTVARHLSQGKTYSEVERLTNASATTISRVNKCLNYGTGGYTKVFKE
jgi:TrpR-related protein YerC/YecD